MAIKLKQVGALSVGDIDVVSVSFDKFLKSGEAVASITSVTDTAAILTADNIAVSVAQLTILQKPVAIGRAIQFRVDCTNAVASTTYTLAIVIVTDGTPTRTKTYHYDIKIAS